MTSVIIPAAKLPSFLSLCHTVFLIAYLSLGVEIKGATSFSWQGKSQVAGVCYHCGGRLSKLSLRYNSSTNIRTCISLLFYVHTRYSLYVPFSQIVRQGPLEWFIRFAICKNVIGVIANNCILRTYVLSSIFPSVLLSNGFQFCT